MWGSLCRARSFLWGKALARAKSVRNPEPCGCGSWSMFEGGGAAEWVCAQPRGYVHVCGSVHGWRCTLSLRVCTRVQMSELLWPRDLRLGWLK